MDLDQRSMIRPGDVQESRCLRQRALTGVTSFFEAVMGRMNDVGCDIRSLVMRGVDHLAQRDEIRLLEDWGR